MNEGLVALDHGPFESVKVPAVRLGQATSDLVIGSFEGPEFREHSLLLDGKKLKHGVDTAEPAKSM